MWRTTLTGILLVLFAVASIVFLADLTLALLSYIEEKTRYYHVGEEGQVSLQDLLVRAVLAGGSLIQVVLTYRRWERRGNGWTPEVPPKRSGFLDLCLRIFTSAPFGILCGAVGLVLLFDLVLSMPIYVGWIIADAPDPNRRGHMTGVHISTSEMLLESLAIALLFVHATLVGRRLKIASSKGDPG